MKYTNAEYEKYIEGLSLDGSQKIIVRLAFLYELDKSYIDILADPALDYKTMDIMRMAAMEQVPVEVLKSMAGEPGKAMEIKYAYYQALFGPKEERQNEEMPDMPQAEALQEMFMQRLDEAMAVRLDRHERSMKQYIKLNLRKLLEEWKEEMQDAGNQEEQAVPAGKADKTLAELDGPEKQEEQEAVDGKDKNAGPPAMLAAKLKHLLPQTTPEKKLITLLKKNDFSDGQADVIMEGYEAGLSYGEILHYADPANSEKKMRDILQIILETKQN